MIGYLQPIADQIKRGFQSHFLFIILCNLLTFSITPSNPIMLAQDPSSCDCITSNQFLLIRSRSNSCNRAPQFNPPHLFRMNCYTLSIALRIPGIFGLSSGSFAYPYFFPPRICQGLDRTLNCRPAI